MVLYRLFWRQWILGLSTHSINYGSHGIITGHVAPGKLVHFWENGQTVFMKIWVTLLISCRDYTLIAVEDVQEKCNGKRFSPEKLKVCAVTLFFVLLLISPCFIMIRSLVCFDDFIINVSFCVLPIIRDRFSAFKFVLPSSLKYLHIVNVLLETTLWIEGIKTAEFAVG